VGRAADATTAWRLESVAGRRGADGLGPWPARAGRALHGSAGPRDARHLASGRNLSAVIGARHFAANALGWLDRFVLLPWPDHRHL